MTHVSIFRLTDPPPLGPGGAVDASPIKVKIWGDADKSDPLNQTLVVTFEVGARLGGRVTVVRDEHPQVLEEAIAALLLAVAEHGAEFRDAIAMEKAG